MSQTRQLAAIMFTDIVGYTALMEDDEQLAFELGFSDASHFSRVFRKTAGESPAEYRKRRQKPPNMIDW